ncbi:kinase-like protein [Zopfia rhizophila CBS 207.26]|uniref:EKC/KEOPS complex subunit BUD32 n=1 Tax=Zopfia rhizophila CBS 207.26 TaxID=1314779 RepID=A0A6A6E1F2_9PEZI|nr:kinase-like protein [Zopfia rhizophila CBS 207.26]
MLTLEPYEPEGIKPFVFHGSTSNIGRLKEHPNAVLKYYKEAWWDLSKPMNDARRSLYRSRFQVEETILRHLGDHPRVVKYIGTTANPHGIWLVEAHSGNLQQYQEQHGNTIEDSQRCKWCIQAAEAVSYIHSEGVLHCDLRPANCLLDKNLDLVLCDFGGSRFGKLSGKGLPDSGFF